MMYQLWENNNAQVPPGDMSDRSDVSSESGSETAQVPQHVYRLIEALAPNEDLKYVDLNDEHAVTSYVAQMQRKEKRKSIVDQIVKLYKMFTIMKLSSTFDEHALEVVDKEVGILLKGISSEEREDLIKTAREERQKQILGEMIDNSLLDPETNLFKKLIKLHKKN
jgi:hypothetical protein